MKLSRQYLSGRGASSIKPVFAVLMAAACALGLGASVWAKARQPAEGQEAAPHAPSGEDRAAPARPETPGPSSEALQPQWNEAKRLLSQGAYLEARQVLERILSVTPDDPWAAAYRALCDRRLAATSSFTPISSSQLQSLKERLRQESHAQGRASAQQEAIERQLRKEQTRWDQELKALDEQVEKDERLKRQQERRSEKPPPSAASPQPTAEVAATPKAAEPAPPAPAPVVHEPASPPSSEQSAAPVEETPAPSLPVPSKSIGGGPMPGEPSLPAAAGSAGRPPIELSPVVIRTEEMELAEGVTPSLVGRERPPAGAVAINALQMTMSPDRKIAIAEGDVEVIYENALLTCDHLTLFTDTKDVYAEGRVRLEEGNQVFRGEMVHYNFNTKKGRFLQGTMSAPPWHEHGRSVEHLAEGVFQVTPGYLTSCELEPPHFRFAGSRTRVFTGDKLARARNVALFVEKLPVFYFPWMSVADRKSPFFLKPGKNKEWEQFAIAGYRYEVPDELPGPTNQRGTFKFDWRRTLGWGFGADHWFEDEQYGQGLLKVYYNDQGHSRHLRESGGPDGLPKGASEDRYRVLFRHAWEPLPDVSMYTDIQEYSDISYRRDLLFREEFTSDDRTPESSVSMVANTDAYSMTGSIVKRMNRFQTVTESFPNLVFDVRDTPLGDSNLFTQTKLNLSNFQTKTKHSTEDTDVVRADLFQHFNYAWNLFRPIEVTPELGIRQTYYNKDRQGDGEERTNGERHVISGQASLGAAASLKLFRIFPVQTNFLGLDLNMLRHIVTPTVSYGYTHLPTVEPSTLAFPVGTRWDNTVSFGLENKLQTKRHQGKKGDKPTSYDLGRFLISQGYSFRGNGNKGGGVVGDWGFDLETTPWSWLALETDWSYPSHYVEGVRDSRVTKWNTDITIVNPATQEALRAVRQKFIDENQERLFQMKPTGHWSFGYGHRFSHNDKTEDSVHFEYQPSAKWYVSAFHRFTWKEVAGETKRFNNLREIQYNLVRDLHDWIGTLIYHVDREYGEELFFTLTLKAFPEYPIEMDEQYHQPKIGSQSDPFSPLRGQHGTGG